MSIVLYNWEERKLQNAHFPISWLEGYVFDNVWQAAGVLLTKGKKNKQVKPICATATSHGHSVLAMILKSENHTSI